jgi:hypothetical protein
MSLAVLHLAQRRVRKRVDAYGNSHGAWVATGGLRHPRPGLKQREPGLFGLVLATSGAVARTAVVACRRFLQDS